MLPSSLNNFSIKCINVTQTIGSPVLAHSSRTLIITPRFNTINQQQPVISKNRSLLLQRVISNFILIKAIVVLSRPTKQPTHSYPLSMLMLPYMPQLMDEKMFFFYQNRVIRKIVFIEFPP
ncbi:hypothetical protein BGV46_21465 [Serratia marcescens]|nr:hypothetical protein RN42_08655 [Serratia marcescens]OHT39828.1 hypothetical protein BGV45_21240 [Serratia marcescens]OHT41857.1 hypothetical protein BGV46_21465 [Serratia marcescens]